MPPTPSPPPAPPPWAFPRLRLQIDDIDHPGADVFLKAIDCKEVLRRAVDASVRWLYTPETAATTVEEIVLILCPMEGVASTSGTPTHKQIRLSLDYINATRDRAEHEITGVIVHEMVHCFQYDAEETCPGGLIEGMADYVRLKENLGPPHWKQQQHPDGWDAGYETTAYFLSWIAATWGPDAIRRLNALLASGRGPYEKRVFEDITGVDVDELWASYCESIGGSGDEGEDEGEDGGMPTKEWPVPLLLIRIDDLDHEGTEVFLDTVKPYQALHTAVMASFNRLYTLANVPRNVKSILLVLRSMDGVAHTTGSKSAKEIHYSLDYIKKTKDRARDEIMGVLVHEVVHCYQHDARGTCPGGLIEGMADYVRLQENLGPPHWHPKRTPQNGDKWDMGYDGTAYFLQWLSTTFGSDIVPKLNLRLKKRRFDERVFEELTGKDVGLLWEEYCCEGKEESESKAAGVST